MFVAVTMGACCLLHVCDDVREVFLFQVEGLEGCEGGKCVAHWFCAHLEGDP